MKEYIHLFTPVSERLPKEYGVYMSIYVTVEGLRQSIMAPQYFGGNGFNESVTHWLDLSKLTTKRQAEIFAEKAFTAGEHYDRFMNEGDGQANWEPDFNVWINENKNIL